MRGTLVRILAVTAALSLGGAGLQVAAFADDDPSTPAACHEVAAASDPSCDPSDPGDVSDPGDPSDPSSGEGDGASPADCAAIDEANGACEPGSDVDGATDGGDAPQECFRDDSGEIANEPCYIVSPSLCDDIMYTTMGTRGDNCVTCRNLSAPGKDSVKKPAKHPAKKNIKKAHKKPLSKVAKKPAKKRGVGITAKGAHKSGSKAVRSSLSKPSKKAAVKVSKKAAKKHASKVAKKPSKKSTSRR